MPAPTSTRRIVLLSLAMTLAYVGIITAAALIIAGPAELATILGAFGLDLLLAIVGLQLLCLLAVTLRWTLLLRSSDAVRLPLHAALGVQLAANTCNVVLPLLGGDLAASWILHRHHGVPWGRSLAASIYARLTGLLTCSLLAITCIALLTGELLSPALGQGAVQALVAVALIGTLIIGISLRPGPLLRLGALLERLGRSTSERDGATSRQERLGTGLMLLGWWLHTTVTESRTWLVGSLLLSLANYLSMAVITWLVADTLGLDASLTACLTVVSLGSLSGMATIVAPGGAVLEELTTFALARQLMGATAATAAVFLVAWNSVRSAPVVLGVIPTVLYLRKADKRDLEPLWTMELGPLLEQLRATGSR
jgi:uncharacterized protein (TIRG00374 family)